jgi:putative heme iron utilization protein
METSPRTPSAAERCRTLVARARSGALATLARDPVGVPYASLVVLAADDRGRPLLLLSKLAEHTQNLLERSEASILVTEPVPDGASPLALGRVTLLGACVPVPAAERDAARATFLAVQPDATVYADFHDFSFYRLEVSALRWVGGFGRMTWVKAEEYAAAEPDPFVASSPDILAHMNGDHGDALLAYARSLAGIANAQHAAMTAVDRYGFDLDVTTPEGTRAARLAFDAPASTSDEIRRGMVALAKRARSAGV